MRTTARKSLDIVGWLDALLFVGVGLGELLFADGSLGHRVLFFAVLTVFAALVIVGIRMVDSRPWVGVGVASVGAILGGFALFWTVIAILLAVAIVVLSIVCARRGVARPA